MSIVAESDMEYVNLIFGRLSLVMGWSSRHGEPSQRSKRKDHFKGAGGILKTIAMICFLAGAQTGGVTVVVGFVVLVAGIAISSGEEIKKLFNEHVRMALEEVFNSFKNGYAAHFPELKEPIEKVKTALEEATRRDFNSMECQAYQRQLQDAGLRPDGTFAE